MSAGSDPDPGDLDEGALARALEQGWGIGVAAMMYRPVGWGSHHWEVTGAEGMRWFVTVDELEHKRRPHTGNEDDEKTWKVLNELIRRAGQ